VVFGSNQTNKNREMYYFCSIRFSSMVHVTSL